MMKMEENEMAFPGGIYFTSCIFWRNVLSRRALYICVPK